MLSTLKILHVFGKMDRGGAEMRTLDLYRRLTETSGCAVRFDFCILSGEVGELDQCIRELGGNLHYLPLKWGFGSRFKKLLAKERYNCVHSHVQLFSGYLLRLAYQKNIPSRLSHIHTTGGYGKGHWRRLLQNKIMKRWLVRYATNVITVSQGAADVFLHEVPQFRGDDRLQLIYDAIDPKMLIPKKSRAMVRTALNIAEAEVMVVHVGRLDPVKNHVRLLKIFAQLQFQRPKSRLVLIGHAPAEALQDFQQQAKALSIESRTCFLGARDDVVDHLAAADIMIFPSLWEGLPGAVLEAAAVGLPVVATDLPGCQELAAQFASIRTCSLQQSDEVWVQAACDLLSSTVAREKAIIAVPISSPFNVDAALEKFLPIWERQF